VLASGHQATCNANISERQQVASIPILTIARYPAPSRCRTFHSIQFAHHDCELIEVGEGLAIFQATPQLKHYNPLGSVHGGWYATLRALCGALAKRFTSVDRWAHPKQKLWDHMANCMPMQPPHAPYLRRCPKSAEFQLR
jgi:acyl-coenzyme A thioesterase PaaI-like protein